jgi:hypothetical protein
MAHYYVVANSIQQKAMHVFHRFVPLLNHLACTFISVPLRRLERLEDAASEAGAAGIFAPSIYSASYCVRYTA